MNYNYVLGIIVVTIKFAFNLPRNKHNQRKSIKKCNNANKVELHAFAYANRQMHIIRRLFIMLIR